MASYYDLFVMYVTGCGCRMLSVWYVFRGVLIMLAVVLPKRHHENPGFGDNLWRYQGGRGHHLGWYHRRSHMREGINFIA